MAKHYARPKTKKKRPRTPRHGDAALDMLDVLSEVRDILLMVLLMQACPFCIGTGSTPDGKEHDGRPRYSRCVCRRRAVEFLSEFEDSGIDPEEQESSGLECHCGRPLENVGDEELDGRPVLRHVDDGTERCT